MEDRYTLKIFQKYARNKQTYDVAASEFNNALSIAEKRVFIVALHKLGIPILATPDSKFDIQNIVFEKREIDKGTMQNLINKEFAVQDAKSYLTALYKDAIVNNNASNINSKINELAKGLSI